MCVRRHTALGGVYKQKRLSNWLCALLYTSSARLGSTGCTLLELTTHPAAHAAPVGPGALAAPSSAVGCNCERMFDIGSIPETYWPSSHPLAACSFAHQQREACINRLSFSGTTHTPCCACRLIVYLFCCECRLQLCAYDRHQRPRDLLAHLAFATCLLSCTPPARGWYQVVEIHRD